MNGDPSAELEALRTRAYPRYLALWLVPPADRPLALALFALEAELEAIPDKVSQPTLGLMRIVWWRDALLALAEGEVRAHPLIGRFATLGLSSERLQTVAIWVETFDAPFSIDQEQAEQLSVRQQCLAELIGNRSANFLKQAKPEKSHIFLLFRALKVTLTK